MDYILQSKGRVAEWIRNNAQLYTAYKRLNSASRTQIGL